MAVVAYVRLRSNELVLSVERDLSGLISTAIRNHLRADKSL